VRYVTQGASSDLEKGVAWTTFLQNTIVHSCWPPIDEYGQAIRHPVALLQDRRMMCGSLARLVVDGLRTLSIPSRVLQMKGHVSSEFFADGRWILAEADILDGGQFLRDGNDQIVGVDAVLDDPSILNSVTPYMKHSCQSLLRLGDPEALEISPRRIKSPEAKERDAETWRSVFGSINSGDFKRGEFTTPYVIKKTATREQESSSRFFGWNYYEFCERSKRDDHRLH